MPGEAANRGAADEVLPLPAIAGRVLALVARLARAGNAPGEARGTERGSVDEV